MNRQDRQKIQELKDKKVSYEELLMMFENREINFLVFSIVAKSIPLDRTQLSLRGVEY